MRRLPRAFFARPVLEVAADLLGRQVEHGGVTVRISETEAYAGLVDPASRVLSRPTAHNAPVFGPAGRGSTSVLRARRSCSVRATPCRPPA